MDKMRYTPEEIQNLRHKGVVDEDIQEFEQNGYSYSELEKNIDVHGAERGVKLSKRKIKKQKEKQMEDEEQSRYTASYKNILWIDDRDDSDSSTDKLGWMKTYLKNPEDIMQIEQEDSFFEAVKKIIAPSKYDLVIFDINLKKCFAGVHRDEDERDLENAFMKYHLHFRYSDVSSEEGQKTAGIYLYWLLLSTGYPIERMLVYTGNHTGSKDNPTTKSFLGKANEMMPVINFKNGTILRQKADKDLDIDSYFSREKHQYYRIRRLIFQACEYWKKQLKDKAPENISFNAIYYNKGTYILTDIFVDMLEHIQMLFPVTAPQEPEKVYYQAMQTISSLHEESAKISNLDSHLKFKKYHSCIRNFRNWTAHNKFKAKNNQRILDGEQFALLFCITLRTYFKNEFDSDLSDLLEYEKIYGFTSISPEMDKNELRTCFLHIWFDAYKAIGEMISSPNINNLVREWGRRCLNMPNALLFLPIWSEEISMELRHNPSLKGKSVSLTYEISDKTCQDLIDEAQKKEINSIFMRYCYEWLISYIQVHKEVESITA